MKNVKNIDMTESIKGLEEEKMQEKAEAEKLENLVIFPSWSSSVISEYPQEVWMIKDTNVIEIPFPIVAQFYTGEEKEGQLTKKQRLAYLVFYKEKNNAARNIKQIKANYR